jgi:FkbM family methyltransferase
MKPFTESLRYDYPVADGWIVMDVGAHHGEFVLEFWREHGAHHILIRSYEPVPEFYAILKQRVADFPGAVNISMFTFGLGAKTGKRKFFIKGGMTGPWADDGPAKLVDIVGIDSEMSGGVPGNIVDLIKINIEGGEYELLEAILDGGMAHQFRNFQIQFHFIPQINPVERWKKIRERLAETHSLEYGDPSMEFQCNTWEGWKIK